MITFFLGNFIADENGSDKPLKQYKDKTLVIVLPGDLTVFDIGRTVNQNKINKQKSHCYCHILATNMPFFFFL